VPRRGREQEQAITRLSYGRRAHKHHDYHLVDPSPWPAVGATAAFVMAVGAISWMHHMYAAALWCSARRLGVLYTFVAWWRDVIREAQFKASHPRGADLASLRHDLFIASEVDVFVAWFWPTSTPHCFPVKRMTSAGWPSPTASGRRPASRPSIPGICRCSTADPVDLGHHGDLAHHALLENDRKA